VDHVEHYRLPKHLQEKRKLEEEESKEEDIKKYFCPGHAYIGQELATSFHINEGQDLFAPPPLSSKKSDTITITIAMRRMLMKKKNC
jgi:hypothetical protein